MTGRWCTSRGCHRALLAATVFITLACATAALQRPVAPSSNATGPATAIPPALVIAGVTLVDVTDGRRLPKQTVVVVGNRVRTVGAARHVRIPHGAWVVDAKGLYLIPGLWDMHVHVDDEASALYPLFIANGVTGLREMAQRFPFGTDSFRVWQHQVAAGTRVGPRVFGPSADNTYLDNMNTPNAARHTIDSLKAAGIAFLKLHDTDIEAVMGIRLPFKPALFFAIAAECRRVGLPFVGHLPKTVTEIQATDSGQRSIEHVEENHSCWPNWPAPLDSLAEQRCAPVAAAYIRNGTWMVPTLVVSYYDRYRHDIAHVDNKPFMRMMHHFGVRMLAGTDFLVQFMNRNPHFQPGRSLHDELVLLVAAGLTPLEALQTSTLNPAIFMQATDSLGTVAPGKLADLVLLDADPLANIHNVRKVHAVVANGRYFNRATLDTMLATRPAEWPAPAPVDTALGN